MFTNDYADKPEIIRAAQVCGARLTKGFFPKWMVDKFAAEGKIDVRRKGTDNLWVVTVTDGSSTESINCQSRFDG